MRGPRTPVAGRRRPRIAAFAKLAELVDRRMASFVTTAILTSCSTRFLTISSSSSLLSHLSPQIAHTFTISPTFPVVQLRMAAMYPKFSGGISDVQGDEDQRPSSAPMPSLWDSPRSKTLPVSSSAAPISLAHRVLSTPSAATARQSRTTTPGVPSAAPLDLMPQLQRSGPSVVKTRTGNVLTRGFILKTDHYPSGMTSYDESRIDASR